MAKQEIELKFGIASEADAVRLSEELGPPLDVVRQHNVFLDGPHGELQRAGLALRLRHETSDSPGRPRPRERLLLTLKGSKAASSGELSVRTEVECALGLEHLALLEEPSPLLELGVEPAADLRSLVPGLPSLVVLGGFRNLRRVYRVALDLSDRDDRLDVFWEFDTVSFPDGTVESEVEVELDSVDAAGPVAEAVRRRFSELGVRTCPQPESKFSRFMAHRSR